MTPPGEDRGTRPPAPERTLDDGMFERVIVDARDQVLRLLRDLAVPSRASPIARLAIASGAVTPRHDARGGVEYVAVALPGLSIHERVGSLFVADYLNRSADYRRMQTCSGCGELSFADEHEHAGWCEVTPEAS